MIDMKDEKLMADITLSLAETIFDPGGALPNPKRTLTPRQLFYRQLFFDFREVMEAYQTLLDFPALSRSKPHAKSGLTPARLIRFWREALLNELYIFVGRLKTYVKPRCSRLPTRQQSSKLANGRGGDGRIHRRAFFWFSSNARGHVHGYRYENSDPELNRIQVLEFAGGGGKMLKMRSLYRSGVRQARHQSVTDFRIFNRQAKATLKASF